MISQNLKIRWLGTQDYLSCWQSMKTFTDARDDSSPDEIWLLEHPPVFTLGQNGSMSHLINPGDIPVVQTDRGGQITYHGPGQLMVYTLIDLKRYKLNVRQLVTLLEQSVIDLLKVYNIEAYAKCKAPGVYVAERKICSIGLRIRKGYAYHGIAFNVAMDLEPFERINPCGFSGLKMTQFADLGGLTDLPTTGQKLVNFIATHLGYTTQSRLPYPVEYRGE